MEKTVLIVFTTFTDEAEAREILRTLAEERLIAAGNILPAITSVYYWEDKLHVSSEVQALLKTDSCKYELLEKRLTELHPYEVPEMLAIKVEHVYKPYLDWLSQMTENGK